MNLLRALATGKQPDPRQPHPGLPPRLHHRRAFGASLATDAFFVAFRIPNLLRRLFAEVRSRRLSCRSSPSQK